MATQWYYASGGQQQGPVDFDALQKMAASGQLRPADLVWSEGMSDWAPASTVENLFAGTPAAPAPSAQQTPQPQGGAGYPPPYGQPQQPMPVGYYGMQPQPGYAQPPPNYLVQAILVTLCCCIPFGIPAIVFAAQVNGKHQTGDYVGAAEASRKAKFWCWMAFGFGLAANAIGGVIQVIAAQHQ